MSSKKSFIIFYSWQSDVTDTKKLITKCLDKATKNLKVKLKTELIEIELDRDTKGKTGTPDIAETIMEKIDSADIFIGDVTLINSEQIADGKTKPTSNPNVLFELGYAVKSLGWDRVICLNDNSVNNIEQLPFDIRSRRVSGFNDRDQDKLIQLLEIAIKVIIENYDKIIKDRQEPKVKLHDRKIYLKINEILPEENLKDMLEWVTSSLYITDLQYSIWEELQKFYAETMNHFIDMENHNFFKNYLKELDDFKWLCIKYLKIRQVHGETLYEAEQAGKEISDEIRYSLLQNVGHNPHKDPYQGESWVESDNRILDNQRDMSQQVDKVFEAYAIFVKSYKTNTLI
jgi:hypothetical protein